MKKYTIILILLLLATPLLAEELTTEETEQVAKKEPPSILALSIFVLYHSLTTTLMVAFIGGHILTRDMLIRRIRNQKMTKQEKKLNLSCYFELIFAHLIAATVGGIFLLWIRPNGGTIFLFQLIIMALIYEILAVEINLRFFESKGIYHRILADSWGKIKRNF